MVWLNIDNSWTVNIINAKCQLLRIFFWILLVVLYFREEVSFIMKQLMSFTDELSVIAKYSHWLIIQTTRSHKISPNYQAVQVISQRSKFAPKATPAGSTESLKKNDKSPCLLQYVNGNCCYGVSLPVLDCQYTHLQTYSQSRHLQCHCCECRSHHQLVQCKTP